MSNLFSPLKLGPIQLSHRIAMTPFTRFHADSHHQVNDLVKPPPHPPPFQSHSIIILLKFLRILLPTLHSR
jgi:hypothetical protein